MEGNNNSENVHSVMKRINANSNKQKKKRTKKKMPRKKDKVTFKPAMSYMNRRKEKK